MGVAICCCAKKTPERNDPTSTSFSPKHSPTEGLFEKRVAALHAARLLRCTLHASQRATTTMAGGGSSILGTVYATSAAFLQDPAAQHRSLNSGSEGAGTNDPFASFLLSLVGLRFPLTESQQAFVVSMLGIYIVCTILLLLLMLLSGVTSCCDCAVRCCKGDEDDLTTFVVLDEKTDIDHARFQALARAEAVDGTPRLHLLRGADSSSSSNGTQAAPTGGTGIDRTPSPIDGPAQADTPAFGKGIRISANQAQVGPPTPSTPQTAGGAASARAPASPACLSSRVSAPLSSRPSHSATTAFAQFEKRQGRTPREPDYDAFGWRDKDSPAWYGV